MKPFMYSSSATFMHCSGLIFRRPQTRFCISSVFSGAGGLRPLTRPLADSTVQRGAATSMA